MKSIAIIHDSFLYYGGAETVLMALATQYPGADIYIPLITSSYFHSMSRKHTVYRSIFSFFPNLRYTSSLLKPLLIIYWETLDLSRYDLVISSSHSFSSKSVNVKKPTKHVSYIHTPPKYLYKEYNQMFWIKMFPFRVIFYPLLFLLRKYDFYSAQKPDLLIANSSETQKRIATYYNRKSVVIHPPHAIPPKSYKKKKGLYYLFFSRLEKQKGVELVFETCERNNIPLVVVGTGSLEKKLASNSTKNIKILGFINEKQKANVFSKAKALIFAAIDEDYGLAVSEATAFNIPIIAYNSGAIKEAAKNGRYVLFNEHTQNSLLKAIRDFEKQFFKSPLS